MINIIIGGDICPINRNLPYFIEGDAKNIFNDLLEEFERSDLTIANLECPLINENTPILKSGPIHAVSSEAINGIKAAKIDVLCLANNHILDHGAAGLRNTLKVCSEQGLTTVGAGKNLKEANKIIVKDIKGLKIGIFGVTEHEFSIASDNSPGANPLDIISFVRTLKNEKNKFDYLIVLVHAGAAAYPLPSPRLRDICRFMAEMGANAVICQHSHCPGTYERYEEAHIVYGQGNLIFDIGAKATSSWNKGFLVQITLEKSGKNSLNIIPFTQPYNKVGAEKMSANEESVFLKETDERSFFLSDPDYISSKWINFCVTKKDSYYYHLLFGFTENKIFNYLHRKFPIAGLFLTKRHRMLIHNIIRCESHREILETIFTYDKYYL